MKFITNVRFWLGIGFVGLLLLIRYAVLDHYFTLAAVQKQHALLTQFIAAHYGWSVLFYMGWYVLLVTIALPLTALSTVIGGFLFGTLPAVIYTNIGATTGATLFFILVRYLGRDTIQNRYQRQLARFNEELNKRGAYYLLSMRFLVFIPFFVENLLAGLSNVSVFTFIWTTAVGIIPGSFVYAFAGKQLTTLHSLHDIFTWPIIVTFILLAFLAFMPIIVRRYQD